MVVEFINEQHLETVFIKGFDKPKSGKTTSDYDHFLHSLRSSGGVGMGRDFISDPFLAGNPFANKTRNGDEWFWKRKQILVGGSPIWIRGLLWHLKEIESIYLPKKKNKKTTNVAYPTFH